MNTASTASEADTEREGDGIAFEIHFDVALTGANADSIAPATQGGIFVGKRSGAVTVGVGVDFARATYSQSSSGVSADTSSTTFLAIPGIRVRIASSQDQHTDLALQADLGIGVTAFSASDGVPSPSSVLRGRLQLAPAMRYWLSPWFAFGGAAGLRVDYARQSMDSTTTTPGGDVSLTLTSLFASLQMVGVF